MLWKGLVRLALSTFFAVTEKLSVVGIWVPCKQFGPEVTGPGWGIRVPALCCLWVAGIFWPCTFLHPDHTTNDAVRWLIAMTIMHFLNNIFLSKQKCSVYPSYCFTYPIIEYRDIEETEKRRSWGKTWRLIAALNLW